MPMLTEPNPTTSPRAPGAAAKDEAALVEALRRGDEEAFVTLVDRYHGALVRTALLYVRDRAIAEEVAQEAWIGALQGIDRFEGRSALATWLFRIVSNKAKTRGKREARTIAFSDLDSREGDDSAVERALANEGAISGRGGAAPDDWSRLDDRLLTQEALQVVDAAIAELPERQRQVILLRDVQGWESEDVCNVLDISSSNQRVLLHRARTKVRQALEAYLADSAAGD